ncbi:MAG: prepilin-type N-terminal cleavage/methylation domain-containing protein [Planctomycetes bacterium]|nr:prepilin-type N-terminal cleavage/methylation domain-containing protein [Planctomycetota bacterium]
MIDRADKSQVFDPVGRGPQTGFTLLEVIAALAILGLAASSVLVVIDRCVSSASDSALRMEAFGLARENLEKILARDSVDEVVEYGTSERYAGVSWQTVVEGFPEPVTGQMWVRAVCSAEYVDSTGETQRIELTHWITQLNDQQAGQLVGQQDLEKLAVEQIIETEQEAATYAKVDADTMAQWLENGLVKTDDDKFLRHNLDVFIQAEGNPTPEQKAQQVKSVRELAMKLRTELKESEQTGGTGLPNNLFEKVRDLGDGRRQ